MKRDVRLQENKNSLNTNINQGGYRHQKQSKVYLPPIQLNSNQQIQKTLCILKKIEYFISQYPGEISNIFTECQTAIQKYLSKTNRTPYSVCLSHAASVYKKKDGKKSQLQCIADCEWGVKSQVINIKLGDVKKVEGRKLFERMRSVKYSEAIFQNDKEIVSALKSRIAEQDKAYNEITSKMEEFKLDQLQKQRFIIIYRQELLTVEEKNKSLSKCNSDYQVQINQLQRQLCQAKLKYKQEIKQLKDECSLRQCMLKQREEEVKALWQTYFSNANVCLL